jgi:uncharacterized protein (DUF2342 family)
MRRIFSFIFLACLLAGLLAACASGAAGTPAASQPPAVTQPPAATALPTTSPAVKAVLDYLQAMVTKNVDKISTLSCKDWEQSAVQEVDSLQAVTAKLSSDLACSQTGTDSGNALVKCQGKILITYNTENQELDLSARTYKVSQSGGDWLVCGYQQ